MKRFAFLILIVCLLGVTVVSAQGATSFLVLGNGNRIPPGLEARIVAAGGIITRSIPQVGIVVVSSTNPNFAASVRGGGVADVLPNVTLQWIPETHIVLDESGNPPNSGDDDPRFDLQWGHDAVDAPEAWAEGRRGDGVRVAVLDSGIDADHPDIAPNLNASLSRSFVPGEDWNVRPGLFFNHGTHVAGTIGAADNGFGVIGVAPEVELVAVKVLSEFTGSGSFEGVIAGIVYAADVDADIINMSLGATLVKSGFCDEDGCVTAREVAALKNALSRATTYAYQRGTTVIVSAGNSAIDRDHDANVLVLPADSTHVIQVSATAPVGWAIDPTTSLDVPTSYTNYGQSAIDFAAPGGDIWPTVPGTCTVAGLTRPCFVFDLVFSTTSGGFAWAGGTSMAAPHVSGVAALIIGANGGSMNPAHVESALRATADDLGKPGNDDWYGAGRVDAD